MYFLKLITKLCQQVMSGCWLVIGKGRFSMPLIRVCSSHAGARCAVALRWCQFVAGIRCSQKSKPSDELSGGFFCGLLVFCLWFFGYLFDKVFQFFVGDIFFVSLIEDGEQINSLCHHLDIADHPAAATFTPALGLDSHSDLIAIVAQSHALLRVFFQTVEQ